MGERFLLYRLPEVSRADIARRSLARRGHEPELRARIKATVGDFLEQFRCCGRLELPPSFTEPLIALSDVVTRARSGVARDFNANLLYLPEPEAPTRLAKQLAQLAAALLAIGVDEVEAWRLVRKAGWDCVPAVRCAVLDVLARHDGPVTHATIQEETGLPDRTTARAAEDVAVLKLARRFKDGGRWHFEPSEIAREYAVRERLPETSEGLHEEALPETSEANALNGGLDHDEREHVKHEIDHAVRLREAEPPEVEEDWSKTDDDKLDADEIELWAERALRAIQEGQV